MSKEEHWFLKEGGVAGATARSIRWTETPVGPPETWPTVLKSTLATMFRARQPMFLWWGPELVQFYNDAYLPSFGQGKHPHAMGQRGRECWEEIWPIIGPQIENVMGQARSSWNEDALVPIYRNGRLEEVYWTYSYTPVFDDTGEVGGTLVICTETTNRVVGERRTRALHDFVEVTSGSGTIPEFSERMFAVFRHAKDDIPFAVLCEQDANDALGEVLGRVNVSTEQAIVLSKAYREHYARHGSGPFALEDLGLKSHSGRRIRHVYLAPCPTENATPGCLLIFGISPAQPFDDNYRRFLEQMAAHLGAAKSRLLEATRRTAVEQERQNLLQQAPFATAVLVGPTHIFESANAKFLEMVGKRDIVGRPYREVFPELEGSPVERQVQSVYETGRSVVSHEMLVEIDRGQGQPEECYFSFTLEPVRDLQGRVSGMMAVAVDITEQVQGRRVLERAHEEREELLDSLKEASQAKDEFLAILGHELRNPLAPILTALRLMREKGDDRTLHEQDVMERQVNHLIRLVDDLLDVSRIARGKVNLRKELVDLRDISQKAVETVSDLLEKRKHRLTLDLDDEALMCHGDPVRLTQIITNLLTNAARYTDPGGNLELSALRRGEHLLVSVKDDGIGISPDMLPLVFSLFKQASRSSDRAQGGLGIGLTLVHNLVTLHGGTVWAKSAGLGKGSEFYAQFPIVDELATADERRPTPLDQISVHPKRVLLVDDNADAVELLAEVLSSRGHKVVSVTEPLEALDVAAHFTPDCAVLDIGLPVIDGYELATRLRRVEGCEDCRLIALSGYGSPEDRRRGRKAGFEEHLVKPVDFDRLLELLDQVAPPPLSA